MKKLAFLIPLATLVACEERVVRTPTIAATSQGTAWYEVPSPPGLRLIRHEPSGVCVALRIGGTGYQGGIAVLPNEVCK